MENIVIGLLFLAVVAFAVTGAAFASSAPEPSPAVASPVQCCGGQCACEGGCGNPACAAVSGGKCDCTPSQCGAGCTAEAKQCGCGK